MQTTTTTESTTQTTTTAASTTQKTTRFTSTTLCPEFICNNGQCILNKHRCDGVKHCFDGSDESRCNATCRLVNKIVKCFLTERLF